MPVTIGRRKLMAVLGGAAATWPLAARAQRGERKPASASATAQNDRTSLVIRPGVECAATAWNHQRLAPNAPIDPASASIVSFLVAQMRASATMIYCAPDQPLYVVDPSTPTVRVKVVDSDTNPKAAWLQQFFNAVPMPSPDTFATEGGSDTEATIYRPATHEYWDGWVFAKTGAKVTNSIGQLVDEWSIVWGGYESDLRTNPGWWRTDQATGYKPGAVAAGIPIATFLVTVGDMKQQEIRHPVGMVIPVSATRGGTWNDPPAQRTDGANFGTQFTPEGAIFRLPANLDLNAYSATFWDGVSVKRLFRLIAEAMQNYGCVIYDQGGNAIMVAEKGDAPQYASDPYYTDPIVSQVVGPPTVGGGFANTYILLSDPTVFPWDQMQLLKMNLVSS